MIMSSSGTDDCISNNDAPSPSNVMANADRQRLNRPTVDLILTPQKYDATFESTERKVLADSGADVCIGGMNEAVALGLRVDDLIKCEMPIKCANSKEDIMKYYIPIEFKYEDKTTTQDVYFHDGVSQNILLSYNGCIQLTLFPDLTARRG